MRLMRNSGESNSLRGSGGSLAGQLATKSEFRAKTIVHRSSVSIQLGLLRPGERKGGEESNGKLPHNTVCQEQSGPYSWVPDAWTKRGTHFTFTFSHC
ncbi:hypothetical protein PoB_002178700 [Plakobranchus ocellatus]|uniref:Uncharacterized protein n=1 Tax=Plakobranchus ocellatus TaxID=259542 RepID=A0AAV3ZIY2_9GAST|nr:hypothetical protein PoB_002178700 [Plakobranchus ocellatus]